MFTRSALHRDEHVLVVVLWGRWECHRHDFLQSWGKLDTVLPPCLAMCLSDTSCSLLLRL